MTNPISRMNAQMVYNVYGAWLAANSHSQVNVLCP